MNRSSKRMKGFLAKVIALILCFVMCLGLAACGGTAPYIGDDGYWYVDGTKTDVYAGGIKGDKGDKGDTGEKGDKGDDGESGSTAKGDTYKASPDIVEGTVEATGTLTGMLENKGKFYPDYDTLEEAEEDGRRINLQIAAEGDVLMKNDGSLPFGSNYRFVTLFGAASVNIIAGGTGSGAGSGSKYTLAQSLEQAGFSVNKKPLDFYSANPVRAVVTSGDMGNISQTVENDPDTYTRAVTDSYKQFGDIAILTLARIGGEGADCATHDLATHKDKADHYLQLDDNEIKLYNEIKKLKSQGVFKKFIVIINSANAMELGELNDDKDVNAILWIGDPGENGILAVGQILNGEINPSGHLSDTWVRDLKQDPTWTNFGDNKQIEGADTTYIVDGKPQDIRVLEQREGIYVGYRWYETKATEMNKAEAGSGDKWYDNAVVYPFGYGLSYTNFEWKLDNVKKTADITAANQTITVRVWVKNVGDVAGKDVVQVYVNPPYTAGSIEKSSANLVGFAKTRLLNPGESDVVEVQFAAMDMASYDYSDANKNGFKGYELEAGDYIVSVNKNSHEIVDSITRTVKNTIKCDTDLTSGKQIKNLFSGENGLDGYTTLTDSLVANQVTRTNMVQPKTVSEAERVVTKEYYDELTLTNPDYWSYQDKETDPWYVTGTPSNWDQASEADAAAREPDEMLKALAKLSGVEYTEPTKDSTGKLVAATDAGTKAWDDFMNKLTWDEMRLIASYGGYTSISLPEAGRMQEICKDGPVQFSDGVFWCCEGLVAATFNTELAHKQGRIIGNESLFKGQAGWYGPGMNMHRSAFGGRNFEYYSEDGILAGLITADVCLGATELGVNVYVKHMFLNDQESQRGQHGGVRIYVNEQAIREIYARPFEYAMKFGRVTGMMTSCQALGFWTGSCNYSIQEALIHGEWGFKGASVSDFYHDEYRPITLFVRTGQELPLGNAGSEQVEGIWDATAKAVKVAKNKEDAAAAEVQRRILKTPEKLTADEIAAAKAKLVELETEISATQYWSVRKSVQRVMYVLANTNNIKNGYTSTMFEKKSVNAVAGTSVDIGVDKDALEATFVTYKSANVPENMTLAANGTLTINNTFLPSFTPIKKTFTVSVTLDGANTFSYEVEVTVNGNLKYTGTALDNFTGTVSGTIASDTYKVGALIGSGYSAASITAVTYSVSNGSLPAGVTLSADGSLSGTVTAAAGTYTVTIRCEYTTTNRWGQSQTGTLDQTMTIIVP